MIRCHNCSQLQAAEILTLALTSTMLACAQIPFRYSLEVATHLKSLCFSLLCLLLGSEAMGGLGRHAIQIQGFYSVNPKSEKGKRQRQCYHDTMFC